MEQRDHRARLHRDPPIPGPDLVIRPARALPPPSDLTDADHEFRDQQDDLLQQLTNHYDPYALEGLDLLVSAFDKTVNGSVKATFREGRRLPNIDENAVKPIVGLTFLPGADTPQVNQQEEMSMTQTAPDQKDSAWRVTTAGALLSNITVHKDMTISFFDNSAAVVETTRRRIRMSGDGPFSRPNSDISPRALAIRRTTDHTLTIDSDNVKIVSDLNSQKWDLEAVLVEVDQASLLDLISNYQRVITRGGPDLPTTETLELLDVMIEDARRLCIRSPILFRMSTRRQIVASKNTRYGVDDGIMFKTLTTSSGIKHIIRVSASYFNSLPQTVVPSTEKQKIQSEVRPRFFQMLVLLLSLLNDDDLKELKSFLEETYGIVADRQHLELLILKVLPLSSINPKIFLSSLITAFDGPTVATMPNMNDNAVVWDMFICRILQSGYILPGTIDQLGCENRTWVVKWTKDGFKDTSIFNNLQYSGASRTINEIPTLNLNPEVVPTAELTVTLANKRSYMIASADLENIIRMNAGKYVVTEAMQGGRSLDLDIAEVWVNQTLFRAIAEINSVLGFVKSILPNKPKNEIVANLSHLIRRGSRRSSGHVYNENSLPEIKGCGRLTYSVAKLNGHYLALSCKVDGRKIPSREMVALLTRDSNKIDATVKAIEATVQSVFEGRRVDEAIQHSIQRLRNKLADVWKLKQEAENRRLAMQGHDPKLASEPVVKVLHQVGAADTQVSVFSEYNAWHGGAENVLFIESQRRIVQQVTWSGETLIVSFQNVPMRYFASPLRALEEHEKWEELKEGDTVLLCGHYLLVVEPSDKTFAPAINELPTRIATPRLDPIRGDPLPRNLRPGFRQHHQEGMPIEREQQRYAIPRKPPPKQLESVVNWLKVTGVETMPGMRRGRNRVQESPAVRSTLR